MNLSLRVLALALLAACCAPAESYYFIQMSDPQFGMYTADKGFEQEIANFEFVIANANRLKPAFIVITGDLVNKAGDREQIAEFKRIAAKLDHSIPLFSAPGNHDVGNVPTPESLAAFRENIGRDYYVFRSHDMAGFVLNGTLIQAPQKAPEEAAKQEQWLRQELEKQKRDNVRHLVIFMHQSFFLESPTEPDQYFNIPSETRNRYLKLFHEYGVKHIFAGHYHRNALGRDGALEMVTTGPVGMPLGTEVSGLRIVGVHDDTMKSRYFGLGSFPNVLKEDIF